jgi:putative molybdopterin biosynthesis protein
MTSGPVNRVRAAREERRLTQGALAEAARISRQSVSAIESGRSEPSVSVAMALARALERPVEDLFGAPEDAAAIAAELAGDPRARAGSRVVLAHLRDRWVAHPFGEPRHEAAQAADGVVVGERRGTAVRIEPLRAPSEARENVVLLGCAPALGLLADRLNRSRGPGRFVWLPSSSGAALERFGRHQAHVAGVHLRDERTGEPNVSAVRRFAGRSRPALVTLARWEAGLVLRAGNPLRIRGVADLGRPGLRVVRREPGAGAQQLLEQQLRAAGLDPARTPARSVSARGHLEAAFAVAIGGADVALTMRNAALAYGLDFVPLAEERFDLVLGREASSDPRLIRLLDVIQGASFRSELASLGGYDVSECGRRVPGLAASSPAEAR